MGCCTDLKSAYKQLALSPRDRHCAVLSVYCPEDGVCKWFVSNVLPFGATGAVVGFNRVARAVHWLALRLL
eukprot:2209986-Amphidinium_carterae.1